MTLLTSMMERPLDPGYAAAAERREREGLPPATSTRSTTVLVAALVTGLLLTVGALSLRVPQTTATRAKAALVDQIEARRAAADARAAQVRTLQENVTRLQASALGGSADLSAQLRTLEIATGAARLEGPGLELTIDDAEKAARDSADANPRTQAAASDGTVQARDLQLITNGLWEAGAEAMAVNGQRLTSRSAIRFAGEAILVNFRPLTRPYRIQAIGPPQLRVDFADTAGGSYLRSLQDNFDIRATIDTAERIVLPSATSLTIRSARVPGSAGSTPTPSSSATTPSGPAPSTGPTTTAPTTQETSP